MKWFMIDDGWLDVRENRLLTFFADQEKFPEGLKRTTAVLKEDYGISWVGVWHTLAGYWGGIHPDSDLAKTFKEYLYAIRGGDLLPHPGVERGFRFWHHWHAFLKASGISFVKVDGQSAIANFFKGHEPIGAVTRSIHKGFEASVALHFNQNLINCMGMASENIWSRPSSALSRNSDDFVPSGEISFEEHALQNVYNSYYHSQFYWGDWDMFWSKHPEWKQGSILRALSGGPIYTSDGIGDTQIEVIWPLVLRDGRILRLDAPGLPTEDCLLKDPTLEPIPLKVWGSVGSSGVLGAFNLNAQGQDVTGTISATDLPSLAGKRIGVYDYFAQTATILEQGETLRIELAGDEVTLNVLVPFETSFAPLGLVNKYLAPATILHVALGDQGAEVLVAEGGIFGFLAERAPRKVFVNGSPHSFKEENGLFLIDCSDCEAKVALSIVF